MRRAVSSQTLLGEGARPPEHRRKFGPRTFSLALILAFNYLLLLSVASIIYRNELSWTQRAAYFGACAIFCVFTCFAHRYITRHVTHLRSRGGSVWLLAVWAVVSAGLAALLVEGVDRVFRVGSFALRLRDVHMLALAAILLSGLASQYAIFRGAKEVSAAPLLAEADPPGKPHGTGIPRVRSAEGIAETPGKKFMDRLPARMGRDVVYLKMSDHYVEVFTTTGHGLLLMRFGDAMAELEGTGIQVHRSYWVANKHVEGLVRQGRRWSLRLTGGSRVPVSRHHQPAIKAALGPYAGTR